MTPSRTLNILGWLRNYTADASRKWTERPSGFSPQEMAALVRRGLVNSTEQSEHVRGERRVNYRLYQITAAGLETLSEQTKPVETKP